MGPRIIWIAIILFTLLLPSVPKQEEGKVNWSQYLNSSQIMQRILYEKTNLTNESIKEPFLIPLELIFQNATMVNELLKERNITEVRIITKEEFDQMIEDYLRKQGLNNFIPVCS